MKYEEAIIEIIEFGKEDIITSSVPGLNNGILGDGEGEEYLTP